MEKYYKGARDTYDVINHWIEMTQERELTKDDYENILKMMSEFCKEKSKYFTEKLEEDK